MAYEVPDGYIRCEVCGEFNGTTDASNLSWADAWPQTGPITVTCICYGILCRRCEKTKIHRPISNTYYPESNEVWHHPYFEGLDPCGNCHRDEKLRRDGSGKPNIVN
jgi:hypothetical protein